MADVYRAIADPTRRAISQRLGVLGDAGLVTSRCEDRYEFHHLDLAPLREISDRWPVRA